MKPRLTYANVTATLALFIALGGVSWAATSLPVNSVGTRQIVDRGVGTNDIADRAVTANKIARGGVDTVNMSAAAMAALKGQKGDVGPAGPKGDDGAKGETGAKGDTGDPGGKYRLIAFPSDPRAHSGSISATQGAGYVAAASASEFKRSIEVNFPIDDCVITNEMRDDMVNTWIDTSSAFSPGSGYFIDIPVPGLVSIERQDSYSFDLTIRVGSEKRKLPVRLAFICPS